MGCQSTLLRLVEDWRKELDSHKYVAAILMDLTKAFDCLPHSLLLGKLSAYGLSDKSCSLVSNYLSNRKQRVKLGPHYRCKELDTYEAILVGIASSIEGTAFYEYHKAFAARYAALILQHNIKLAWGDPRQRAILHVIRGTDCKSVFVMR